MGIEDVEMLKEELAELKARLHAADMKRSTLATLRELEDVDFDAELEGLNQMYGSDAVQRELAEIRYSSVEGFERAIQTYDGLKDSLVARLDPELDKKLVAAHVALHNLGLKREIVINLHEWEYGNQPMSTLIYQNKGAGKVKGPLFVSCAEKDGPINPGPTYLQIVIADRDNGDVRNEGVNKAIGKGRKVYLPTMKSTSNLFESTGARIRRCPSLLSYKLRKGGGNDWVRSSRELAPQIRRAIDTESPQLLRYLIDEVNAVPGRIGEYLERRNQSIRDALTP